MTQRIDAHHHLWAYKKEEFSWISDEMRSLQRDFLIDELRVRLSETNVQGTIAIQARQTIEETSGLLDIAATPSAPIMGVVGWLPISSNNFLDHLEKFAGDRRLKGLRHIVQSEPAGFLDDPAFNRGISLMHNTDLVYDLLVYESQLEEALRFVDRHSHQSFVLDHIGKPDIAHGHIEPWSLWLNQFAKRPNVSCKLSGMVTEADWKNWTPAQLSPYFDQALTAFGPNRLMIGTDWPVVTLGCSYSQWWQTVETWISPLSNYEQSLILGGTAARVYNLNSASESSLSPDLLEATKESR